MADAYHAAMNLLALKGIIDAAPPLPVMSPVSASQSAFVPYSVVKLDLHSVLGHGAPRDLATTERKTPPSSPSSHTTLASLTSATCHFVDEDKSAAAAVKSVPLKPESVSAGHVHHGQPARTKPVAVPMVLPEPEMVGKERLFHCQFPGCGSIFNTRFSLKRHWKRHTGERPFVCTFEACGRRFAERSTLKRHQRTHTGERPYRCNHPGCGKRFADRTNVRRHLATHKDDPIYLCPVSGCQRSFGRQPLLHKHMAKHHSNVTMPKSSLASRTRRRRGRSRSSVNDDSSESADMLRDFDAVSDWEQ